LLDTLLLGLVVVAAGHELFSNYLNTCVCVSTKPSAKQQNYLALF
jgi:hypothetical protein